MGVWTSSGWVRIGTRGVLEEREHCAGPVVNGMILLKWIIWKWDVCVCNASGWVWYREIGKLGGKGPLSRPRRKWDDIIEVDLQEVGYGCMDCIGLVRDREMGKLVGKTPLSRPRSKWDNIIEIDLQEVGCERMDCIWPGQDREIGKVGGKKSLSRPRRKWDDIIEIDLQEV